MLFSDEVLMLTERDEFYYHEMVAHVPMAYVPHARRALVLGGGDGAVVLQLLQYEELEEIVVVEWDEEIVDFMKDYMPRLGAAFSSPRVSVVNEDAVAYVADMCTQGAPKFDIVIGDTMDGNKIKNTQSAEFYADVAKCAVADDGIYAGNMRGASWGTRVLADMYANVTHSFDETHLFQIFLPTSVSSHMSAVIASNAYHPFQHKLDWNAIGARNITHRYYNRDVHYSSFILPKFIRHALGAPNLSMSDAKDSFTS